MPTYEYECSACGGSFEIFHSISEPPRKKCPSCGKNRLKRLMGAGAGLIFKGSGFYITDYRSEAYKAKAKAESEASTPKSEASESKTEKSQKSEKPAPADTKATPAKKKEEGIGGHE